MEKEIENLIKEYRELEEKTKNIEPILINNKMYFIDEELYEDLLKDIKTNYIPKSKIKEFVKENKWDLLETEYHFDSTVVDADELLKFMEDK